MTTDRRQHPRTLVEVPAKVEAEGAAHSAVIKDISDGGAGIAFVFERESDRFQFEIGTAVTIAPAQGEPKRGVIVREYVNGVGVKFDD